MKRVAAVCVLLSALALVGCGTKNRYSTVWYDTFDTVVSITGYAANQSEFDAAAAEAHAEMLRLHKIFDLYHETEGVAGVYAANRGETVLEEELVDILAFCDSLYDRTGQRTNPRMGALLRVWHDHREAGTQLPSESVLQAAAEDRTQLDLGAVAKGYAVERVAALLEARMPSFLIDAGGNIRAGAPPPSERKWWTIGINNPSGDGILAKLAVSNLSVVTSAVDQRYYEVDNRRYHHIIDPDTLMPGGSFPQVTIITKDSGLADYLSTAVFLLPYEEGRALVESFDGVDAIWVRDNSILEMTDGAKLRMIDGV